MKATNYNITNPRRTEAEARNAFWASLSPEEQLASLDARLGAGVGAIKQRAKITALIEAGKIATEKPTPPVKTPKVKTTAKQRRKAGK